MAYLAGQTWQLGTRTSRQRARLVRTMVERKPSELARHRRSAAVPVLVSCYLEAELAICLHCQHSWPKKRLQYLAVGPWAACVGRKCHQSADNDF
eukprot:2821904-Pleurochrysis_carterae.AAC.2